MNVPGELIDHLTVLLETTTGVVEVDLGLFENPQSWFVVQLGQRTISGNPPKVPREQVLEAMRDMGWPKRGQNAD